MSNRESIMRLIYEAIDEFNLQHPPEEGLEKSAESVLFGPSGRLDSLGLVDLILAAEQKIAEELDVAVTLADEKAMSQKTSPFRTVASLADYICLLLDEVGYGQ
jgi:D-alanine--poly(phosphoribitol) ligase subunit 2